MSNKEDQIIFMLEAYELDADEIADRLSVAISDVQELLDDHICSQWDDYYVECAGCEFDNLKLK